MQAKNNGELQPTGGSKLCIHADNLLRVLCNTDPPEQQAYTTAFRPREVVGPPTEVVARPTLTPLDQTLHHTENELPASFLDCIMLKSPPILFALARTPGNKGLRTPGLLL